MVLEGFLFYEVVIGLSGPYVWLFEPLLYNLSIWFTEHIIT